MTRSTDPFDELRSQLEIAHTPAPDAIRGRSARADRRRATKIGLLATAAVLVTGTAVAATTPWSPTIGGDHGAEPPSQSAGNVPAVQAEALEVLRRPQSESDRNPAVLGALRTVSSRLGSGLNVDGIRLLRKHSQDSVLLLPFERVGPQQDPGNQIPSGLCVYTANVSDGDAATPATIDGVPAPTPISAASCGSLADVQHGRVKGLVPDGVARVRITLTSGNSKTIGVASNYYELPSDNGTSESSISDTTDPIWLDGDGQVVPKTAR